MVTLSSHITCPSNVRYCIALAYLGQVIISKVPEKHGHVYLVVDDQDYITCPSRVRYCTVLAYFEQVIISKVPEKKGHVYLVGLLTIRII